MKKENNKVKPEGVGEWDKHLEYFYFTKFDDDRDFCKELQGYIDVLFLQEKAKWKEKINERFVEIINQNTECKKGMFVNYIEGLDKAKQVLLTLIDKL